MGIPDYRAFIKRKAVVSVCDESDILKTFVDALFVNCGNGNAVFCKRHNMAFLFFCFVRLNFKSYKFIRAAEFDAPFFFGVVYKVFGKDVNRRISAFVSNAP